jgi:hypothetical protein
MYHFDAERVSVTVMGIELYEFGKGEFLTLTQREKPFVVEEGTHGSVTRVRVPSNVWDLKVSLIKGSPINALISARVKLDMLEGSGMGALQVKDLEGSSLVRGNSFFFPSEVKYSTDPIMNEWEGIAEIRPDQLFEGAARFLIPQ